MQTAETVDPDRRSKRRKAIVAGTAGFFVDMFDVYLPIIALAPAISYFVSPQLTPSTVAVVSSLLLIATLVGRPVGALIFGHLADRIGRKRALIISVSGFGGLTIVIGALPGYAVWGAFSLVLFIILRFVIGIFIGGEYTAASPLAMEYSEKRKRGINSAIIMAGAPAAIASVSLLTLLMLQIAPMDGPDSPYALWGWRIPFFIGGIISIAFVMWVSREVSESPKFEEEGHTKAPLKRLLTGANIASFAQVFVLMSGFWFTAYAATAILPGLLTNQVGLSSTQSTLALAVTYVITIGAYLFGGVASQALGRKRFMLLYTLVTAIGGSATFAVIVNLRAEDGILLVIVFCGLATIFTISQWGTIIAYINERFHTGVRASAFGLGYSLAVVIPSFYAFYQSGFANLMPTQYTAIPIVVIGAVLIAIGTAMGPETRDIDL